MSLSRLPFQIDEEVWGEIVNVEEACPDVYYIVTRREGRLLGRELFAVSKDYNGDIISKEALSYGVESNNALLFEAEAEGSGWELIDYEVERYKVKHGIPLDPDADLYSTAIYGTEKYPEYFGGYIPPRYTPYGLTTRVKVIVNGIFFLETDQCLWLFALCQPIWSIDLSEHLQEMGELCSHDLHEVHEETSYLFYSREKIPPVLFELLRYNEYREGILKYITTERELTAAIWQTCPQYAIWYNFTKLSGNGCDNWLNLILRDFGHNLESEDEERERLRRIARCILYEPGVSGSGYLLLPT